jgi:hypothetical protein
MEEGVESLVGRGGSEAAVCVTNSIEISIVSSKLLVYSAAGVVTGWLL